MSASALRLCPTSMLQQNLPIVHCTDIGFDMDDFGAYKLARDSGRLAGVITSLYRPDEKKAITEAFDRVYTATSNEGSVKSKVAEQAVRVFSGEGYYPNSSLTPAENRSNFLSLYPRWPTEIFGDPIAELDAKYKCIYPYQCKPFIDNGIDLNPLTGHSELVEFIEFLEKLPDPILYVCTGPTTNLEALLRTNPDLVKAKIKMIVMMNGRFLNPPRMGYNGGLNFEDTKMVFDSGIPCLIVTSELCQNYKFPIELVEQMTKGRDELSKFGKLFHDIMLSWEIHRARKRNPDVDVSSLSVADPILADPLTMLLALHPEFIGSTRPVKFTFEPSDSKLHLLHPESSKLVRVEEDPNSTVFEVTSITDSEEVLKALIQKLNVQ